MPLIKVAEIFGLSETFMKRICRHHGIERWPYREVRRSQTVVKRLSERLQNVCGSEVIRLPDLNRSRLDELQQIEKEMHQLVECSVAPPKQRVPVWDTTTKRKLTGRAAPYAENLAQYLENHPHITVYDPSCDENMSDDGSPKCDRKSIGTGSNEVGTVGCEAPLNCMQKQELGMIPKLWGPEPRPTNKRRRMELNTDFSLDQANVETVADECEQATQILAAKLRENFRNEQAAATLVAMQPSVVLTRGPDRKVYTNLEQESKARRNGLNVDELLCFPNSGTVEKCVTCV